MKWTHSGMRRSRLGMSTMLGTDTATIVRKLTDEGWNQGKLAICDELLAPSFVGHNAGMPDLRGIAANKQFIAAYRTAFPDLHMTVEELVTDGDRCVARLTATGTQTGPLAVVPGTPSIPPTGKRATLQVMVVHHVTDGKVVELWSVSDTMDLMQQLGMLPAPATPAGIQA